MAKGTLLYFVSDLHGSSLCFRKFVNDPLGRESSAKFDFSPN